MAPIMRSEKGKPTEASPAPTLTDQDYRTALEVGKVGVWEWDITSGLIRWSPETEAVFGFPQGGFDGSFETYIDRIHPNDREPMLASIDTAVKGGPDHMLETRIIRPNGDERWLLTRSKVERDAAGAARRMVGVTLDITKEKRAEQRLLLQYQVTDILAEVRDLTEAAPRLIQAICEGIGWNVGALWEPNEWHTELDCRGVWHVSTDEPVRFLKRTRSIRFEPGVGLPGRVWQTGKPAWIPDVVRDDTFIRAVEARADDLHAAFAFPITSGSTVLAVADFYSHAVLERDEELLGAVERLGHQIGSFIQRRQAESRMKEGAERHRRVIDAALDAIVTMDASGVLIDLNPAAEDMFGYTIAEIVGREMADLFVPEKYRSRHREGLDRVRTTGEGPILGKRLELTALRRDGTEFPIELTVTPVDPPGNSVFTAHVRDITEARSAEEERAALLESEHLARMDAEVRRDRLSLLSRSSELFVSTTELNTALAQLTRLLVPQMADWCTIELLDDRGRLVPVETATSTPDRLPIAQELIERSSAPDLPFGPPAVARSGQPELYEEISPAALAEMAQDERHAELLDEIAPRSAMIVPLIGRSGPTGVLSFTSCSPDRAYGASDLEFACDLGRRAGTAIESLRLSEERSRVASILQASLLPPKLPDIPGVIARAAYRAASRDVEVGGDFYDLFPVAEDAWIAVMGDVSGKGPEAAAFTGLARHTVRAVGRSGASPEEILHAVNAALMEDETERFCTVACVRITRSSEDELRLVAACGGHPLPLILGSDTSIRPLGEPGTLLGLFFNPKITEREDVLTRGESLIMFTDGVEDATNGSDAAAVLREILDITPNASLDEIVQRCTDAGHAADHPDDRAVMAVRLE